MREFLKNEFRIDSKVVDAVLKAEAEVRDVFEKVGETMEINQYRVLKAFQENNINDTHFNWNTGYGYNDGGREAIERVYASVFGSEKALVRTQIVNGTHALSLAISSCLRPGDKIIYCSGKPYDTLEEVIGIRGTNMGSLKEYGISYDEISLNQEGRPDFETIAETVKNQKPKMVCMQRATGYAWRPALSIDDIARWVEIVKKIDSNIICMVDNCYGEFLDVKEPTHVGVDVLAGSLIKNPGGGIALSGGYVAGKACNVEAAAYRLTCPGIGGECGLMFGQTRSILQGLFMAPTVTASALKGSILCSQIYKSLGFSVCPEPRDHRSDIIQSIKFENEEKVKAFCQGIQKAAPVDSYLTLEPWGMPGYEDPVIMAAGAFIQGSSIELSADAPIRDPYIAYFQGGLTYEHSKFGVMKSLQELLDKGLINL